MPFAGDLAHIPIVDVIQLLHSTKKSGTLYLKSEKGESQLVFHDGYIVSANHTDNSIRIGQILVGMKTITPQQLEQALQKQSTAGQKRKPLIATLIESNQLNKEDAYRGLETLIEMSIVDILSWTSGSFRLSVDSTSISDEYRYFPETLNQELLINTQGILMDALRIFDEKMRDGTLKHGVFNLEQVIRHDAADRPDANARPITADILGLDELETLEKKVPDVYLGLKDYGLSRVSTTIDERVWDSAVKDQNAVYSGLEDSTPKLNSDGHVSSAPASGLEVIIFSQDEFIIRIISNICKYSGLQVFSTDNSIMLNDLLSRNSLNAERKLLIYDAPHPSDCLLNEENVLSVIQSNSEDPKILATVQLFSPMDYAFSMKALLAGAHTLLPRPLTEEQEIILKSDSIDFMKIFQLYLSKLIHQHMKLSSLPTA